MEAKIYAEQIHGYLLSFQIGCITVSWMEQKLIDNLLSCILTTRMMLLKKSLLQRTCTPENQWCF